MIQHIDAAWNDIGQPAADETRRYLKATYPLRDRRSHKVIRFHNVNSGWYDTPCFAYPWGYSNIKQNCPTVDKSILDYVTRVMSTHIQIDQQTEDVDGYSDRGNHVMSTVTEQYIAARQSPLFCQYLQEWKDPEVIGPIQIPSRTTVSEAVKLLLLAGICENTSDDAPDILTSDIERILSDQQRLNEIEDCPLWELLVKPNQHSMPSLHPDSHSGKNAFYTIGLHGDYRFGGIHSFVIDSEYRQAFLAKEAETGIDAQTIMKCIGKDWSEKPYRRCGQKIEAFSNLLSLLDGNERVRIQQDQLEAATLDILRQEEIVTKIYSGDYILSKGVDIDIITRKIVDLKSEREGEYNKWFQSSISLQPVRKKSAKPQGGKETKRKYDARQGTVPSDDWKGYDPRELEELQKSLLAAFSASSSDQPLGPEYLSRLESHLREIFAEFKIDCSINYENFDINGPRIIRANIKPGRGVTISSIQQRSRDIANRLYSASELFSFENDSEVPKDVYIETVPAKGMIGIHIPRKNFSRISIRSLLETLPGKSSLEFPVGMSITGEATYSNLISMPHLLIAGHSLSGKSVFLNSLIVSLLFQNTPADLKLQLIDPKGGLEFGAYKNLPYLYGDIVDNAEDALDILNRLIEEQESRYRLFEQYGVKKLSEYNELEGIDKKPFIVLVIDEFTDLTKMDMGKEVMGVVHRLAQKGRAAGLHLVVAAPQPSVKVIESGIKANLPARLSFRAATQSDSRIILDEIGAEKLFGDGDCFLKESQHPELRRFQAAYVLTEEINTFVTILRDYWRT